jgi:hypothetical protein
MNGGLYMSREMSEWLELVEKFANEPSPTNYLRLITLTEVTIRAAMGSGS